MPDIWFKPKTWGWGYVPVSLEGWIATLIFVGVLLYTIKYNAVTLQYVNDLNERYIRWILSLKIELLVFIYIADKHSTKPLLFK